MYGFKSHTNVSECVSGVFKCWPWGARGKTQQNWLNTLNISKHSSFVMCSKGLLRDIESAPLF